MKLAGMNRLLWWRVYRESSQAWFKIDFDEDKRLTDYDLSRLLTRVNAGSVTNDLDLFGCNQIRGSGLAPLRHSRVLQRLDLRGTPAFGVPYVSEVTIDDVNNPLPYSESVIQSYIMVVLYICKIQHL